MNPHPHAAAYRPRRFRRPGNPAFALLLLVAALALSAAARLVGADDEQPKFAIVEAVLLDGEDGYPIPGRQHFLSRRDGLPGIQDGRLSGERRLSDEG